MYGICSQGNYTFTISVNEKSQKEETNMYKVNLKITKQKRNLILGFQSTFTKIKFLKQYLTVILVKWFWNSVSAGVGKKKPSCKNAFVDVRSRSIYHPYKNNT